MSIFLLYSASSTSTDEVRKIYPRKALLIKHKMI